MLKYGAGFCQFFWCKYWLNFEVFKLSPLVLYCPWLFFWSIHFITHHSGKSGAFHLSVFTAMVPPPRTSFSPRDFLSFKVMRLPHAPQTCSAISPLMLIMSSLKALNDNWRLLSLSIVTVLPETVRAMLFFLKLLPIMAFPFACTQRWIDYKSPVRDWYLLSVKFLNLFCKDTHPNAMVVCDSKRNVGEVHINPHNGVDCRSATHL